MKIKELLKRWQRIVISFNGRLSLIHARPVGSTAAKPREGKKGADDGLMADSGLLMV